MSQCDCNGCVPPEGKCATLALLLFGQRECVNAAAERYDVGGRSHWTGSTGMTAAPASPNSPAPSRIPWWHGPPSSVACKHRRGPGQFAIPTPSSQAAAQPRYLLQWVDQEPILFEVHIGISASNLRCTDSSEASFLFEQTDLCFSRWRFASHTNWLSPVATAFMRKELCLNLQISEKNLSWKTVLEKKSGEKRHILQLKSCWHNSMKIKVFFSSAERFSSKFEPTQYTQTHKDNKGLILKLVVFCSVTLNGVDKTGTQGGKKGQRQAKWRSWGGSVPSGLVAFPPAGSGGRYDWSLTQWQEQAGQWPAPRSESIWTQTPSPQLFLAPCRHTWNTANR